jgi:hypothetical protein
MLGMLTFTTELSRDVTSIYTLLDKGYAVLFPDPSTLPLSYHLSYECPFNRIHEFQYRHHGIE